MSRPALVVHTSPSQGVVPGRDPDRHYVRVQAYNERNWQEDTVSELLDEITASGDQAYRIEANGADGLEARRKTGHTQMVLMSCPMSHYEDKRKSELEEANRRALTTDKSETLTRGEKGAFTLSQLGA